MFNLCGGQTFTMKVVRLKSVVEPNLILMNFFKTRVTVIANSYQMKKPFSTNSMEVFLDNLSLEEGKKREFTLLKYFDSDTYHLPTETFRKYWPESEKSYSYDDKSTVEDLVRSIEEETSVKTVPNNTLNCLLVFFAKKGNINGVKAVQFIVKKHNLTNYILMSEYKHYLAEALWIKGDVQDALQLFSVAYDNSIIQPRVKAMLTSLFPLLIDRYSEVTLCRTISSIEKFSAEKQDGIILAYLWKELFQSTWFSDQSRAKLLLEQNNHLVQAIQWMVPSMGKKFLKNHDVDDFYRLFQCTLENELKTMAGVLLRLLFDYYYIQKNIERCTSVVKYATRLDSQLTEEQESRYISLLLKSKNAASSKQNKKKPQNVTLKF